MQKQNKNDYSLFKFKYEGYADEKMSLKDKLKETIIIATILFVSVVSSILITNSLNKIKNDSKQTILIVKNK